MERIGITYMMREKWYEWMNELGDKGSMWISGCGVTGMPLV